MSEREPTTRERPTMSVEDYSGYTREEITELLEWNWALPPAGERLHHVARFVRPDPVGRVGVIGVTTCHGGKPRFLGLPGILSRIGTPRCKSCCRKLGIPEGTGSPKNDDALRPLVEERLRGLQP